MRLSYRGEALKNKAGVFTAWNLGADYCSEHEWGIKNLQQILGIKLDDQTFGIDRRRIKNVPEVALLFVETKTRATLVVGDEVRYARQYGTPEQIEKNLTELVERYKPYRSYKDIKSKEFEVKPTTAWDDGCFIIAVEGKEAKTQLKELHDELVTGGAAIWLGGGGVFENAGLVIAIVDRIDPENLQVMFDKDKERHETAEYVKKLGIEKKLEKAGKKWFALSPGTPLKTRRGDVPINTKYEVMFWLNPYEQHIHNSGWFTVEELEQWAENKGPVMKAVGVDK